MLQVRNNFIACVENLKSMCRDILRASLVTPPPSPSMNRGGVGQLHFLQRRPVIFLEDSSDIFAKQL